MQTKSKRVMYDGEEMTLPNSTLRWIAMKLGFALSTDNDDDKAHDDGATVAKGRCRGPTNGGAIAINPVRAGPARNDLTNLQTGPTTGSSVSAAATIRIGMIRTNKLNVRHCNRCSLND